MSASKYMCMCLPCAPLSYVHDTLPECASESIRVTDRLSMMGNIKDVQRSGKGCLLTHDISILMGNFSELVPAFISLHSAILMQFDRILQAHKPCPKSCKLANLAVPKQFKFKFQSSKFFLYGMRT